MSVQNVVASNWMLGVVVIVLLLIAARKHRSYRRELAADQDRGWPLVRHAAVVTLFGTIVWISLVDSWRQLTSLPFRATRRWDYQRIEIDPTSPVVRGITIVLVALLALLVALIIARYVGGIVIQAIVAAAALFVWLPFFVFRQRFNIDLAMGFGGDPKSPFDLIGYVIFVLGAWAFEIGLILVLFAALAALVAIPVTLVLDLTRLRRPRVSREADDFFASISARRGA